MNNSGKKTLCLIAHNIRSAYNIGSIFRTADGAGVKKIFLTGFSDCPYNLKSNRKERKAQRMIAKTALGAEKNVSWEKRKSIDLLIKKLKKENYQIIALEKNNQSVNLKNFRPKFPCALILGNEIEGVGEECTEKCDQVVSIPMNGNKESLNVAVASAIAIYKILDLI